MIAIPACAGIGGFLTPAGTPSNILILDILKNNNIVVTFWEWCLIGFPIGIFTSFLFLIILVTLFNPNKEEIIILNNNSKYYVYIFKVL
jgi:sodium-dependent dicarboxylate transporter 2/3/5